MCWEAGQESCQRPSDNGDIPTLGSAQRPSLEVLTCQAWTPGGAKEAAMPAAARMPSPALSPRTTRGCAGGYTGLSGSQEAGAVAVSLGVRGDWNLAARETETSCGRLRAQVGSRNPDRAGSPEMPKM